jgi:hypothetical protein
VRTFVNVIVYPHPANNKGRKQEVQATLLEKKEREREKHHTLSEK